MTPEENKVWCNDPTLTPICKWCLEEILQMKSYSVSINCCVLLNATGYFDPPDKIFIDQHLNKEAQLRALFHELRHYYQFKNGIYDFIREKYKSPFPDTDYTPTQKRMARFIEYLNFPWERDASTFTEDTMPKFKKSSFASFASSS